MNEDGSSKETAIFAIILTLVITALMYFLIQMMPVLTYNEDDMVITDVATLSNIFGSKQIYQISVSNGTYQNVCSEIELKVGQHVKGSISSVRFGGRCTSKLILK